MTRTCFFPHCRSKTRLFNATLTKKKTFSLFKPRDAETLEKWKKSIGKTHREMTLKDLVCELHFDEDDILRFFEHKMNDGTIYRLQRGHPDLKPGSVPTIFLEDNMSLDILENKKDECDLNSCNNDSDSSKYIMGDFKFKDLAANIDEIELPFTSWGISNISEMEKSYIIFTKWNDLRPERWVVIDENLNVKVSYKDKEINSMYQEVKSILDVNNLLKIVHQYVFCSGVNDNDICSNILEESTKSCGRKKKFCDDCFRIRRRKAENLRRRTGTKKKLPHFIVQQISNIKKEFPC